MNVFTNLSKQLVDALKRELARFTERDEAKYWLSQRVKVENYWKFDHVRDGKTIDQWAFENLVVTTGLNYLLDNSFSAVPASVAAYVGLIGAGTGTVAITAAAASVTGTTTAFAAADVGSDIIIVGAGAASADLSTTVATFTSATAITTAANAGTTVSGAGYAIEPRPADTMASKSFNEGTPYSNATRPTWTKNAAASGGAMSNSTSKASFTINATSRVYGAFLATDSTKSGTTGILYGGGLFTSTGSRAVQAGDTLNAQVDLSVTAA